MAKNKSITIAVGADHRGYRLKEAIREYLLKKKYRLEDLGTYSDDSCDYPLVAYKVAMAVSTGRVKRGILVCSTGIGMCIAANKILGVRCAVCYTTSHARFSRLHNDTNVLSLASRYTDYNKAKRIVKVWLDTEALPGRHRRRVKQIEKIEISK